MAIEKQMLKKNNQCKVKFMLPGEIAEAATSVHLVGDFNNWDRMDMPMKKRKDGTFYVSIELEPGREYQFRYLLDNHRWENDSEADKHVPSGVGDSTNSVLSI